MAGVFSSRVETAKWIAKKVRVEYYELILPYSTSESTGWFTGTGYDKGGDAENVKFVGIAA